MGLFLAADVVLRYLVVAETEFDLMHKMIVAVEAMLGFVEDLGCLVLDNQAESWLELD